MSIVNTMRSPASRPYITRCMRLGDAIREFVAPGDHLHFASTPSRSNASIREVARIFSGRSPEFLLSTSGFHSTAHLLARLRLGRRYLACFFGDKAKWRITMVSPHENETIEDALRAIRRACPWDFAFDENTLAECS